MKLRELLKLFPGWRVTKKFPNSFIICSIDEVDDGEPDDDGFDDHSTYGTEFITCKTPSA